LPIPEGTVDADLGKRRPVGQGRSPARRRRSENAHRAALVQAHHDGESMKMKSTWLASPGIFSAVPAVRKARRRRHFALRLESTSL
jgi:hypothetical protein